MHRIKFLALTLTSVMLLLATVIVAPAPNAAAITSCQSLYNTWQNNSNGASTGKNYDAFKTCSYTQADYWCTHNKLGGSSLKDCKYNFTVKGTLQSGSDCPAGKYAPACNRGNHDRQVYEASYQKTTNTGSGGPSGSTTGSSGPSGSTTDSSGPSGSTTGSSGPSGSTTDPGGPSGTTGSGGPTTLQDIAPLKTSDTKTNWQCGTGDTAIHTSINICGKGHGDNAFLDLLFSFIRFLSNGVGLVLIASLIYGGIQYTYSRGDPQATAAAITRIRGVVTALLLFVFAYAILNYLIPGMLLK